MDTTAQVEKFLRDIRRRNRREIILGILAIPVVIGVMLVNGLFTDNAPFGSLTFFGFVMTILAILFNVDYEHATGNDQAGPDKSEGGRRLRQCRRAGLQPLVERKRQDNQKDAVHYIDD